MVDDRINIKLDRVKAEPTLKKIKILIIEENGALYGNFSDKILYLLELGYDFLQQQSPQNRHTHTHFLELDKNIQKLDKFEDFSKKYGIQFETTANPYELLVMRVREYWKVSDIRSVNVKVEVLLKKLSLAILKLESGIKIVISKHSEAYDKLQRFDIRYKGIENTNPNYNFEERNYVKAVLISAGLKTQSLNN